jgi:hypothetical protein
MESPVISLVSYVSALLIQVRVCMPDFKFVRVGACVFASGGGRSQRLRVLVQRGGLVCLTVSEGSANPCSRTVMILLQLSSGITYVEKCCNGALMISRSVCVNWGSCWFTTFVSAEDVIRILPC